MKKLIMVNKILSILVTIGLVVSLLYKNNLALVISTVLEIICVIITFSTSAKANK